MATFEEFKPTPGGYGSSSPTSNGPIAPSGSSGNTFDRNSPNVSQYRSDAQRFEQRNPSQQPRTRQPGSYSYGLNNPPQSSQPNTTSGGPTDWSPTAQLERMQQDKDNRAPPTPSGPSPQQLLDLWQNQQGNQPQAPAAEPKQKYPNDTFGNAQRRRDKMFGTYTGETEDPPPPPGGPQNNAPIILNWGGNTQPQQSSMQPPQQPMQPQPPPMQPPQQRTGGGATKQLPDRTWVPYDTPHQTTGLGSTLTGSSVYNDMDNASSPMPQPQYNHSSVSQPTQPLKMGSIGGTGMSGSQGWSRTLRKAGAAAAYANDYDEPF